jgi:riboflavin kinase / FMN adenylyltransferase
MKIVRDNEALQYDRKSAVTVGTFDGVHLGHRQIIKELNKTKEENGLRSVIVTFDPHPQIVLRNKAKDIKLLNTTEEKLDHFRELDIDLVYIIDFTKEFSQTHAVDFYENYLINKIGLSDLVLGYDHMFGKDREGNFETLSNLSKQHDFTVHKVNEYSPGGEHVSSTEIRNTLLLGDIQKANRLLGEKYSLSGTVIHGSKKGRELGFPTANIEPDSDFKLIPKTGIYAVKVKLEGYDNTFKGMMSIGYNPTVTDENELRLEVNILDFNEDIYGKKIKVNFLDYIREEKKFNSLKELINEMNFDKEKTLNIINNIT